MNPIRPLEWDATKVGYLSWQEIHSRVHAQIDANTTGSPVPSSRKINTTAPLAGGGNLSADRTLSIMVNGITNALLAQMPASTFKGNNTAGLANAADLTVAQAKTLLAISLTTDVTGTLQAAQFPSLSGDVTTPGGSLATSIANNVVTNTKLAQMAANTLKGNNTAGSANASDLTIAQVIAMLGLFAGPYLAYASAAGAQNNVNPGGGWPAIGRLDVTLAAGNANWTGMVAGTIDGQSVLISNADATNTLTLNNQNNGSTAANRYRWAGDLALPPGATVLAVYYAGTVNRWVLR